MNQEMKTQDSIRGIEIITWYAITEGGLWQKAPTGINSVYVVRRTASNSSLSRQDIAELLHTPQLAAIQTNQGHIYDFIRCKWEDISKTSAKETNTLASVLEERGNRYGPFSDHAQITQALKTVMIMTDKWPRLTNSQKESLEMIAHKIGRILNGDPNYADSWVDIAGYAQLIVDQLEGKDT